jgi:hypothetical protein
LIKNVKPDDDASKTTETPVFIEPEDEYKKYFKELSTNEELYDLEVINKGKAIAYSEVENTK